MIYANLSEIQYKICKTFKIMKLNVCNAFEIFNLDNGCYCHRKKKLSAINRIMNIE